MAYLIQRIAAPTYTTRQRRGTPRIWLIHATGGHTSLSLQDDATISWFTSANPNRGGWGPTADVLISADDDRIIEFRNPLTEHGTWSAGYGNYGPTYEWGMDEESISIELAQTNLQEPFTGLVLDKLAWYVAKRTQDWGLDIPTVRLSYVNQLRSLPVPTGWVGHKDTANGSKTGKSDPAGFPWDEVLADVRNRLAPAQAPALKSKPWDIWRVYRAQYLRPGEVTITELDSAGGKDRYLVEIPRSTL